MSRGRGGLCWKAERGESGFRLDGGRWRGWSDDGEEAKEHEKGEGWR